MISEVSSNFDVILGRLVWDHSKADQARRTKLEAVKSLFVPPRNCFFLIIWSSIQELRYRIWDSFIPWRSRARTPPSGLLLITYLVRNSLQVLTWTAHVLTGPGQMGNSRVIQAISSLLCWASKIKWKTLTKSSKRSCEAMSCFFVYVEEVSVYQPIYDSMKYRIWMTMRSKEFVSLLF